MSYKKTDLKMQGLDKFTYKAKLEKIKSEQKKLVCRPHLWPKGTWHGTYNLC